MFFTNASGIIASFAQSMYEMLPIIIKGKTTMSQAKHARAMRILPGEQAGAAGRTGWRGTERLAKQDSFLGESLNIGGSNGMTIGLNIAPGIVRVDIEDIWTISVHRNDSFYKTTYLKVNTA